MAKYKVYLTSDSGSALSVSLDLEHPTASCVLEEKGSFVFFYSSTSLEPVAVYPTRFITAIVRE